MIPRSFSYGELRPGDLIAYKGFSPNIDTRDGERLLLVVATRPTNPERSAVTITWLNPTTGLLREREPALGVFGPAGWCLVARARDE